jgi:hypothetical protein
MTRPKLKPMHEFDPAKPAVMQDSRDEQVVAWTGEEPTTRRGDAKPRGPGTIEWNGAIFNRWEEVMGGDVEGYSTN